MRASRPSLIEGQLDLRLSASAPLVVRVLALVHSPLSSRPLRLNPGLPLAIASCYLPIASSARFCVNLRQDEAARRKFAALQTVILNERRFYRERRTQSHSDSFSALPFAPSACFAVNPRFSPCFRVSAVNPISSQPTCSAPPPLSPPDNPSSCAASTQSCRTLSDRGHAA
jgi:hypothetical protein